jgi:hypothetical protein
VAYGCGIYECQIDTPRIISSDNQDMHTCPAIQLNRNPKGKQNDSMCDVETMLAIATLVFLMTVRNAQIIAPELED